MENQQIPTNAYGGAPVNESTGFGNTTNMANAHTGGVPGQQQGTYDSSNTVPGQQPGTYDSGNTVPGQHPGTYTSNDTVTGQQSGAYTSSGTVPGHAVGTNAGASTGSKIKGVATQVHVRVNQSALFYQKQLTRVRELAKLYGATSTQPLMLSAATK